MGQGTGDRSVHVREDVVQRQRQWGKFTDDDLMQIEGNYDKFKGKVQERYGDQKDELETWANKWYGEAKDTAKQTPSR